MLDALLTARSRLCRGLRRWPVLLVVLAGLALAASACGAGGSASPGVASLGSTTTATTTPAGAQGGNKATNYAVAYAQCMRTKGVPNMPDPDSNGDFLFKGGRVNGQSGVEPGSSQYQKADRECSHLLPNGGQMTPAEQQQAIAQTLKFVQCMRTHGVPDMPDPRTTNGGIVLGGRGLDPGSPTFQAAQKACRSLSPF